MATRGRAEELRRAVDDCRARGLAHAATWACEQLVGLGASARDGASASAVGRGDASMMAMEEYDNDGGVFSVVVDNSGADDIYQLAKSYFDLGEYRRCAYALKDASAPLPTFVREYATF